MDYKYLTGTVWSSKLAFPIDIAFRGNYSMYGS